MGKMIEQTLTSLEVAEMVGKEHKGLLKDIRRYTAQLGEGKIAPTDFWTESTYKTEQNKTLPCYHVTKKGCEFIAHKLTGQKGTEFTARYINRFHEMENAIMEGFPGLTPKQILDSLEANTEMLKDMANRIGNLEDLIAKRRKGKVEAKDGKNLFWDEKDHLEQRVKVLNQKLADLVKATGKPRNKLLHLAYKELAYREDVSLDSIMDAYRYHTGDNDACLFQVIATEDGLYSTMVEMMDEVLERHEIFG